ncbi:hypothetical protein EB796_010575 [Bugula neritina]|uniref:Uncharacterized protein n=1 Tax=Bugula neritina TaxID=10212 RepID=A0A7J7JXH0_BUGNE|nr:hypothetical protein EB796_010575 [Bugula neritina]
MVEPRVTRRLPVIRTLKKKEEPKPQTVPTVLPRIPTRIRGPPLIIGRLSSAQRLRRDKTFHSASTPVGKALVELEHEFLTVDDVQVGEVLDRVNSFIYTIAHRINKNRHNLKFGELYFSGPALNNLGTKLNFSHLNLYFPLKFKEFRLRDTHEGYTKIYLNRNPSYDRFQSIRSNSHKNLISPIKISAAIHEMMTHICQSVGRGTVLPFDDNPSSYGEGGYQVVVLLDDYIRLTVIPTLHIKLQKREVDETIIVAKPYLFDKDPESDTLWRYDNPSKAKRLLTTMNHADRGTRSRALCLLHICCMLDPVLQLCPHEFVSMVMFSSFDEMLTNYLHGKWKTWRNVS